MRLPLVIVVLILVMSVASAFQTNPDIRISQISQTPDPVEPGDYVDLRFRVDNLGAPASSYLYELETNYPFTLDPDVPREISLGTVSSYSASGDGAILYWRVRVAPDAVPGDRNTVTIRYRPRDAPAGTYFVQEFPVRIGAQEGLLVVSDARIDPAAVIPGRKFMVSLDLENLGTALVRNVRITSDVEGTPFSPFGSANARLVRQIDAGAVQVVEFEFFVAPGSSLGVERLAFAIEYSDSIGNRYSIPATVGIPLDETPSYLINLESSNVFVSGTRGEVVVSVSNTGSSPLNFVVLSIADSESYEVIGTRQTYLGNLQSDDFETGQFRIFVDPEAESVDLDLDLSYRTAFGEQMSESSTVSVPIYSQERAQEFGLIPSSNGSGVILFAVVLVLLIGGFVWYRRKCKSR